MKRWLFLLFSLLLVAFEETPAFAQGPRRGDHMCFGGDTLVSSTETPDNVVLFGCGGRIQSGVNVRRDVISFGGDVVVEEGVQVGGDVVVFGGNGDIGGHVGHRVISFGGNLTLEPGSVVEDDVQVFGGNLNQKQGATVRGRVTFGSGFRGVNPGPVVGGGGVLGVLANAVFGFVRTVVTAIAFAVLGALTVIFLPKETKQVGETARAFALPSIGVGCLTMVVWVMLFLFLIFAGVLLVLTIIGIPVAVLLFALPPIALAVVWLFGWVAVGRLVGEQLLNAVNTREILPVVAVVVGVVLLTLVGAIPFIGGLVAFFFAMLGIGAVILTRFGTQPYPPLAPVGMTVVPPTPPAPLVPMTPVPPVPPTPAPTAPPVPPVPPSDPGSAGAN